MSMQNAKFKHKEHLYITIKLFSFKRLLLEVTCSKDESLKFMKQQHILLSSVKCPGPCINGQWTGSCGKDMELKKTNDNRDQYMWRCRRVHKVQTQKKQYVTKDVKLTIRHNSWLVDAKLPLETVLEMAYLWAQAFSLNEIIHKLKITNKTAIDWCTFFRECCISCIIDNSTPIGGNGIEVEIDESKFGKRKYYRGHQVEGQWVFGGREKYDKTKIFMIPMHNRKQKTLLPLIQKWIKPGSIIHSDCWKAYCNLNKMGYTHVTVNHSKEFKNQSNAACTNCIESEWWHTKVYMPKYGVHKGLHTGYLAEFMWRCMNSDRDKFICLLSNINETFEQKYLTKCPK